MLKPFKNVRSISPGRSAFDLSYAKLFTCEMGELIPIMHDEMVPGDRFEISSEVVVRMQPLVAPVLHEIQCRVDYFFVPYRILWDDWEDFISGGVDGDDSTPMVKWHPLSFVKYTLWDYFGFPLVDPVGAYPTDLPKRAYYSIWNEYYRDENLQTEVDITDVQLNAVKKRCWTKDYFTSALLSQQRGTAPSFPLAGQLPVQILATPAGGENAGWKASQANPYNIYQVGTTQGGTDTNAWLTAQGMYADASQATTFDVADIRLAFQIQKWQERNNRAGVRYTEFLKSHFSVSPRDDRLQRPEFIGSTRGPVVVSEVVQTSESSGTPQGTLAGHGIAVNQSFCGKYFAQEFGVVIGLLSIMPVPMYCQGINRQWRKETRYDYFFPEFANLSEQEILNSEIYVGSDAGVNNSVFGFQGRYDEMRSKQSLICSDMRDTFDYWHLARLFGSLPTLDDTFVQCNPSKRIFASDSERGFIVHAGNKIKAIRPIPVISEPGLIDH